MGTMHDSSALRGRITKSSLLVALVGAIVLAHYSGATDLFDRETLDRVVHQMGALGPLAFSGIKVFAIVVTFPTAPLTIAGGYFFGPFWGTAVNVAASTLGACVAFFIGRALGGEALHARFKGRLKTFNESLDDHGLRTILFVRLVPIFPFNAINYGAGLTRVRFRDYLSGTVVGIIPGTAIYSYLGYAAGQASLVQVGIALTLLGLLASVPFAMRSKVRVTLQGDRLFELLWAYQVLSNETGLRQRWQRFRLAREIRCSTDPRLPFALLRPMEGLCAENLDAQLEELTRDSLDDPRILRIDSERKTLHLGPIFWWHRRDIGDPVAFVEAHLSEPRKAELRALGSNPRIRYHF